MTVDEMIEVLQAYKEGKSIEGKFKTSEIWDLCTKPIWDFDTYDYRVRREPRVIYVAEYKNGTMSAVWNGKPSECEGRCNRAVKFVEVLE